MAKKKEGIQLPENITRDMMDEAARDFISLNEQLKKIQEQIDYKKALMIKGMDKDMKVDTKKYQYLLIPCDRATLSGEAVERIFKIKLTDECYKNSHYNQFKVTEIINAPVDTSVKEVKLDDIKL